MQQGLAPRLVVLRESFITTKAWNIALVLAAMSYSNPGQAQFEIKRQCGGIGAQGQRDS